MSLDSVMFLLFLILTFAIYWLVPDKQKQKVLLAASCIFYAFSSIRFLFLLLAMTLYTYRTGILLSSLQGKRRKTVFILSILLCLLPLFLFKYLNFSLRILSILLRADIRYLNILLPLGISFYSFEAISYLSDVYHGADPEQDLEIYACYLTFFPTISSGPIERFRHLIPQLKKEKTFSYEQASYGLKLFAFGLFKKMVIADNIACYIDPIYAKAPRYYGFILVLAIVLYPIQIYADFSGYSDMVRGIAKLFGLELIENFKAPYFSTSLKEYWSKWHISLSTWLRDYIYIPLGGNRAGRMKQYRNLLITFLISGLWHGASFSYVAWGLIHGVTQVIENLLHIRSIDNRNTFRYWLRVFILYGFLCITWVFFRCETLGKAFHFLDPRNLIVYMTRSDILLYFHKGFKDLRIEIPEMIILILLISLFLSADYACCKGKDPIAAVSRQKPLLRWIIYVLFVLILIYFSYRNGSGDFVYSNY